MQVCRACYLEVHTRCRKIISTGKDCDCKICEFKEL